KLFQTIAKVVGVLRLVATADGVRFHHQKIRERSNPQPDSVRCPAHIVAGYLEFDGIVKRLTASLNLEDTKVCEQLRLALLELHFLGRKKLDLHLHALFSIL